MNWQYIFDKSNELPILFLLHPFLPLSGYGSVVPPLTPTAVAASLGAFFFLLLFTLSEALKVFSQQRWRHCLVALRHVRFHGGSSERPERPAASPRLPASVHPLGIVRLGIGEHLVGPHQASSRAVVLSSDVPLPSCHLDYRGRRTPSGFSPTFTGSWHLAEGGFEPGTID